MKKFTIQEIIKITNVSKRTLHYYDEIGLLCPYKNNNTSYREYTLNDLVRLQKIIFFKKIGLSLNEILEIIDKDSKIQKEVIEKHKINIKEKIIELKSLLEKIDNIEIGANIEEVIFQNNDFYNIDKQYEKEAEIKYGNNNEYEYFKNYAKSNNFNSKNLEKEINEIYKNLYDKIDEDVASKDVQKEIDKLYKHFKTIMNCNYEVFYYICLGYVEDVRFNNYFKKFGDKDLPCFILEAVKFYIKQI